MSAEPSSASAHLPPALDERAWEVLLSEQLGAPIEVRYGRARREVIQLRRERSRLHLRLGPIMAHAPGPVQHALGEWIAARGGPGHAQRVLDRWIDQRLRELARLTPRAELEPRGDHHDLRALAARVRESEFEREFTRRALPELGWGRPGRSRSRRSLRLGSFDPFGDCVRVHRVLDSRDVPEFFVRYILFHELLHAVLDQPPGEDGRRRTHGPRFRERERRYADYARALEWETEHIRALIACARAGVSFSASTSTGRRRSAAAQHDDSQSWLQRLLF